MAYRLIPLILSAGTGLLLGGQVIIAADRVELYDRNSYRTGHIIIDQEHYV